MAPRRLLLRHALHAALLVAFAGAIAARPAAAVPSFTAVGYLPDGLYESRLTAISADGTVAVGTASDADFYMAAVRWTSGGGLVSLGVPTFGVDPEYPAATQARDANTDGSIIVGNTFADAFLWTPTGYITLGHLPLLPPGSGELGRESAAVAVSGDGSLVAGYTDHVIGCVPPNPLLLVCGRTREGFLWTQAGGIVPFAYGLPVGISAVGDVIVGYGSGGGFRLSVSDGLQSLPPNAPGGMFLPLAVSADGTAVVGGNATPPPNATGVAARWTAEEGTILLGTLPGPGAQASMAFAASGDGATVVGWSGTAQGPYVVDGRAFVWDAAHGMRDLASLLTNDLGLDLGGMTLIKATDVSSDGNVVVGYGLKNGNYEGFVAVLPEPSQHVMLIAGLALLVVLGRRRTRASRVPYPALRQSPSPSSS